MGDLSGLIGVGGGGWGVRVAPLDLSGITPRIYLPV